VSLDSLKQQIEKKAFSGMQITALIGGRTQKWVKLSAVLKLVGDLEKTLQEQIRHMIREAENDEIADVRVGCYSLAEKFGLKVKKDEYGEYYLDEGDEK